MVDSIAFKWREEEFDSLYKTCLYDDGVQMSLGYLSSKSWSILEAGCGSGRVIKYLSDLGYKAVYGLECSEDTLVAVKRRYQDMQLVAGDVEHMPFECNTFDAVLSFGVVEHFHEGLHKPLRAIYDVLKPNGLAIITVPSMNTLRRLEDRVLKLKEKVASLIFFRLIQVSNIKEPYYVYPRGGPFFEYRLTKKQFEDECMSAGFSILASRPISHIDGLYHSLGPLLVQFHDWRFDVSLAGYLLNRFLKMFPFFHNHMHVCVLRKIIAEENNV